MAVSIVLTQAPVLAEDPSSQVWTSSPIRMADAGGM